MRALTRGSSSPAVVEPRVRSGGLSRRLVRDTASMAESLRLVGLAFLESLAVVRMAGAAFFSALGLGGLRGAFRQVRRNAERQRRWVSRTGDREITSTYGPDPDAAAGGLRQLGAHLADPARARDLDWHLLNPVPSALGGLTPWVLAGSGGVGVMLSGLAATSGGLGGYVYYWGLYLGYGGPEVLVVGGLGAAQVVLAPPVARLLQRIHRRWVRFMLAGEMSESLEERVRTLTATRMTALDMQEAEIQRIERDLHDGAQARLVSIGMTATQAGRLLQDNPEAARALLDDVKNDSAVALQELRTLVRGIRPPVLADRGLPDALRALAASSPVETVVTSRLDGRLVGSVESALYFAVSELLTNVVKHSSATRVLVELAEEAGDVVVEVMDDGLGGAEEREVPGGGLAGVRRRLEPFDGTLEVVSPVGGGTFATIRVPRPAA